MMTTLRKTLVSGLAGVAMIAGGSLTAPTQANAHNHRLGYFIGGLALGTAIAHPYYYQYYGGYPIYRHYYYGGYPIYRHYYRYPVRYHHPCHWEKEKYWSPYYGWSWHTVKACW